ncbi:MAG: hypothetical protein L6V93_17090 [Clostridiales bacterium]|nr:MAG: hypothetical protein L6V93_17090 [Clostridiales bacterium]
MYMIPNTASEYSTYVSLIRGDLREKYGMDEIKTVEDYEKYLENVAKNDKNIIPLVNIVAVGSFWGAYKDGTDRFETPKGTEIYYDIATGKFTKREFEDYYKNQIRKTRELVEKGIIPADIVANKTTDNMFENGKMRNICKKISKPPRRWLKSSAHSIPNGKIEICDFFRSAQRKNCKLGSVERSCAQPCNQKNADKAFAVYRAF